MESKTSTISISVKSETKKQARKFLAVGYAEDSNAYIVEFLMYEHKNVKASQ